jgi:hypothetical protein
VLDLDGLNNSLDEIVLNSSVGNGASARSIDRVSLMRIKHWIFDLKPACYPFPIDRDLAERGRSIYQAQCASCHAFDGDKTGTAIPVEMIGIDPHRLVVADVAGAFNAIDTYPWRYRHFRKTAGNVAGSLDGISTRAPYLGAKPRRSAQAAGAAASHLPPWLRRLRSHKCGLY